MVMQAGDHAAPAPAAPTEQAATPAAIVGAVLLALVMATFVWLGVREGAARTELAAAEQARRAAALPDEATRIRTVLINAQAAAERIWRASTPPDQRRAQEAAMLQRLRAEDDATLTMQRLRRLGESRGSGIVRHSGSLSHLLSGGPHCVLT